MTKKLNLSLCAIPLAIVFYGFWLSNFRAQNFYNYVREDGFTETLTVLVFLMSAFLCLKLSFSIRNRSSKLTYFFLFLIFVFGLGEEISWGQRIFNIQSSEFFIENNAQKETNLHNLKISGVKINKLVFGKILGVFLALYFLLFPWLYKKYKKIQNWVSHFQIPVPDLHHIITFTLCFIMVEFTASSRRGELMEVGGALVFLIILLYPLNKDDRDLSLG